MNLVAKNLNNVVFILDLAQPSSLVLVAQNLKQFITRGIPVRFGLVPLVSADETAVETELAKVVLYLVETAGRGATIRFLQDVSSSVLSLALKECQWLNISAIIPI